MFKILTSFILAAILIGCTTSGPKKTLENAAKAMETNNPGEFLANFDMKAYAANYLSMRTSGDKVLDMINDLGNALGVGSLDGLLNSIMDVEADIRNDFTMGVSTGELMAQCRTAETPNCPWVPQSLRSANITEIGQDAAIAKVTTPAQLTSWLSLRKNGDKWVIVAIAPLENQARKYAQQPLNTAPEKAPAKSGATPPKPETPQKSPVPKTVHI